MTAEYTNPVYAHTCPDPFVLKYCGEYWCYFTGLRPGGRAFGILHSTDLVHWQPAGSALDRLPGEDTCYWAPEVVYQDGVFYLYYAVGDEERMHLRVATAARPEGPFTDLGRRLTSEQFAIDPHVFIDDDGRWYMFYATDFLEHERVGTGTVMDGMLDPLTLAVQPRPVTRARYDWQIYDPQRLEKGGVRWHTIEGPFVLKHNGRYYQMFSAGKWKDASYGVSYAVTDRLDAPGEWSQVSDGMQTLPVLRSIPDKGVIGPGHNSVVRAPDNRELFAVYHRWQPETEERVLAIDRLVWEGDRLQVLGPTVTPQPAPAWPGVAGFDRFQAGRGGWGPSGGEWRLEPRRGSASASLSLDSGVFVLEVSLRQAGAGRSSEFGLALEGPVGEALQWTLRPEQNDAVLRSTAGEASRLLPAGFSPQAFHLLRIEAAGGRARVLLDGGRLSWEAPLAAAPQRVVLFARRGPAAFAGFALTYGE